MLLYLTNYYQFLIEVYFCGPLMLKESDAGMYTYELHLNNLLRLTIHVYSISVWQLLVLLMYMYPQQI